jgi:hypothetical protein
VPPVNRSARLLLVDRADRILLLSVHLDAHDPAPGVAWCTPGGDVHDGEPLRAAVAR